MRIHFLGTGGGRFTTINQLRKTGGMLVEADTFQLHIDPGPGALVNGRQYGVDFASLDYLLVTHGHTDQANDTKAIIEAMTQGCTQQRGTLFASPSVLHGYEDSEVTIEPWVHTYHLQALETVHELGDRQTITTDHFTLQAIRVRHGDPETYGFTLQAHDRDDVVGFVTDTSFFDQLPKFFRNCSTLIINLLRPHGKKWRGHMTTDGAATLINAVQPKMVVLQHFGHVMVYAPLKKEAQWLQGQVSSNTKVIWAQDYQTIDLLGAIPPSTLHAFTDRQNKG